MKKEIENKMSIAERHIAERETIKRLAEFLPSKGKLYYVKNKQDDTYYLFDNYKSLFNFINKDKKNRDEYNSKTFSYIKGCCLAGVRVLATSCRINYDHVKTVYRGYDVSITLMLIIENS